MGITFLAHDSVFMCVCESLRVLGSGFYSMSASGCEDINLMCAYVPNQVMSTTLFQVYVSFLAQDLTHPVVGFMRNFVGY